MIRVQKGPVTFLVDVNYDSHADAYNCRVITTTGEASSMSYARDHEGVLIPVLFQNITVFYLCIIHNAVPEELTPLPAENTLFVSKDGPIVTADSNLEILPYIDALRFANPRDRALSIIPDSAITNQEENPFYMEDLRIINGGDATVKALTIFEPVPKYPLMYRHVDEGVDSLEMTDLKEGMILMITYSPVLSSEIKHAYVKVGA